MPVWETTGLALSCHPPTPEHIALPWDAADDYLLHFAVAQPTLTINDRHGALSCALTQKGIPLVNWHDSANACETTRRNHQNNQLKLEAGQIILSEDQIPSSTRQVLIKLPKNLEQLKFWLQCARERLPHDTRYLLAGMVKHMPVSWLNWLEQEAATYRQEQVVRKARLLELTFTPLTSTAHSWSGYQTDSGLTLSGLPGVFSRQQHDIGSRVLLEHTDLPFGGTLCDLGCGNGLLGLTLKQAHPELNLILTDDSWLAVRSAQHNARQNQLDVCVRHGDILAEVREPLDWIVCNPPFHDGHKQLTNIAERMFEQSAKALISGGRLLVIANRHLPYAGKLRRLFQTVEVLSADSRFSLYLCQKR
ncbi:MAG: methyltransferase [Saccharospirillaceae bacterium]|nr:methyltransferase [Saccharospirillaceae bacterium]